MFSTYVSQLWVLTLGFFCSSFFPSQLYREMPIRFKSPHNFFIIIRGVHGHTLLDFQQISRVSNRPLPMTIFDYISNFCISTKTRIVGNVVPIFLHQRPSSVPIIMPQRSAPSITYDNFDFSPQFISDFHKLLPEPRALLLKLCFPTEFSFLVYFFLMQLTQIVTLGLQKVP